MKTALDSKTLKAQAEIFKALSHETRLKILNLLKETDLAVNELVEALGNLERTGISKHLAILKKTGIVACRGDAAKRIYHLTTPCIMEALSCVTAQRKNDS